MAASKKAQSPDKRHSRTGSHSREGGNPHHLIITDHLTTWTSAIKSRATTGRGRNKKTTLHGIKKLRELILELAVRGLLVPQDPNDEPASVLLEKIAAEKEQLIKNNKIKNQENLPEVTNQEALFSTPTGWRWTRLGNISEIAPRNILDDDVQVAFVPMPLVTTSYKGDHGQETRKWSDIKKGYTHFADGDIALAKITPCFENSKAAVFKHLSGGYGAGTTELHIARPIRGTVDPLFILLYLKAPMFLEVGKTKMTGSAGQKRVPKDFFAGNPLPLPPLAEQHRIVTKVDELMALCDQLEQQQENSISAHQNLVSTLLSALTNASEKGQFDAAWCRIAEHFDTLFTTEHSIDQLKQTVLQLAVMGKLVPQDPNDEPASVLLEKITTKKVKLIEEGRIKKQKPLPPINENEKPFDLPNGWIWCRLQDSIDVRDGTHDSPKDAIGKNTYPLITSKNFINGKIDFKNSRRISKEDHEEISKRSFVEAHDILFSMIGGNIGNQVMVEDPRPFSIKNVALFKYFRKDSTS